jgi:hypothetical protein
MPDEQASRHLAECFWPGVSERDQRLLDQRAELSASELSSPREPVRYLGSILIPEDEVVLCLFEGSQTAVQRAAERAQIPFERILATSRSSWPVTNSTP